MSFLSIAAAAAAWLAASMTGAWLAQRVTHNCGWVDAIWSGATGFGAASCALAPPPGAAGPEPRAWLAAAMAAAWGLRLAWHIARRTAGGPEDARYADFRREWGAAFEPRLFGLLMVQAACAWVLVVSVLLAARNPAPFPRAADIAGLLLLAASVAGEARADAQLRQFRARGSGGVCDTGLWEWSRHPNYFFEFLGWCAFPLLAIDVSGRYPAGFLSLAAPALMFWLLRYVSGVPPLEKSMLARRGHAFRAYQARVSVFFPRPPAGNVGDAT
jgi:steroid 5-alpha reductase family enzyme